MSFYVGDRLVCRFGWNEKRTVPQVGYLRSLRSVHVLCVSYHHPSRLVMLWLRGVAMKYLKLILYNKVFSKLGVICFTWTDDGIFRRHVGDTVYITPLSKKKKNYTVQNIFCLTLFVSTLNYLRLGDNRVALRNLFSQRCSSRSSNYCHRVKVATATGLKWLLPPG
jgi:hypothetical protein